MRKIPDLGFYLEPYENINPDTPYIFNDANVAHGSMWHSKKTENGEIGPLIYNRPTYVAEGVDLSNKDYTIEVKIKTSAYLELIRVNESGSQLEGYNYDGLNIWYTGGYLYVGRVGYPGAQYFARWKIYLDEDPKPEFTDIVVVRRAGNFEFYVNGELRYTLKNIKHSPKEPYFMLGSSANAEVVLYAVTIDIALPLGAHWNYDLNNMGSKPLTNSHLIYKASSNELTVDDVTGRYLMDIYSSGSWLIAVFTNRERVAFFRPRGLDSGKVISTVDFFEGKLRFTLDDGSEIIDESIIEENVVDVNYPTGRGILSEDGSRHLSLSAGEGVSIRKTGSLTIIKSKAVKTSFATEANCVIFEEIINCEDNALRPYFNVVDTWIPVPETELKKRASSSQYFLPEGSMFVPAGSYVVELDRNIPINQGMAKQNTHFGIIVLNKTLNEVIIKRVVKLDNNKNLVNINEAVEVYLPIKSEIEILVYSSGNLSNVVHDTVINTKTIPLKVAFKRI